MQKQYSAATDLEIQRVLERYRQNKTQGLGSEDLKRTVGGKRAIVDEIGTTRHYRFAKTEANSICASYPSRPANTFPIKLGKMEWTPDDNTCGCKTRTFTEYPLPVEDRDRLAHDFRDTYHPTGSIVRVFLCHGKWFIDSEPVLFAEAILTSDLCATDSDLQTVPVEDMVEMPYCYTYEPPPTKIYNPYKHRGPAGSKVLLMKKRCTLGTDCIGSEEWHVVDIKKQTYCAVVGLEDRESCLVAAGLRLGGEWCPDDEPITACNVVDYIDCDDTLPECDTDWVFTPLYACCGQGETPQTITGDGGGGGSPIQGVPGPGIGIPGMPGIGP